MMKRYIADAPVSKRSSELSNPAEESQLLGGVVTLVIAKVASYGGVNWRGCLAACLAGCFDGLTSCGTITLLR